MNYAETTLKDIDEFYMPGNMLVVQSIDKAMPGSFYTDNIAKAASELKRIGDDAELILDGVHGIRLDLLIDITESTEDQISDYIVRVIQGGGITAEHEQLEADIKADQIRNGWA